MKNPARTAELVAELMALTIQHMAERAGVTSEDILIAILTQPKAKERYDEYINIGLLELKKAGAL